MRQQIEQQPFIFIFFPLQSCDIIVNKYMLKIIKKNTKKLCLSPHFCVIYTFFLVMTSEGTIEIPVKQTSPIYTALPQFSPVCL